MMAALRAYWRPETGVFLVLWLGLMVVGRTELFRDPGTFWHTEVGRRILESSEFPTKDEFSFTRQGERWIAYHWLGEVGMAAGYAAWGWDGLLLLLAASLAALYAWVFQRLRRAGFHWSLALVLVGLTLAASVHNWHVRPHMATLFGVAITYAVLLDIDAGRLRMGYLLGLVPLFLVWANVHGGVLGGLATLIIAGGGWLLAYGLRWPTPIHSPRDIAFLVAVMLACGIVLLLTPYGPESLTYWLRILSLDLSTIIQEHAPLVLTQLTGMAILAMAAVYAFTLAGILPDWPRLVWVVPLFWLWQTYERNRHGPLFAVTATLAIAAMMSHTRWASYLSQRGSDLFRPSPAEVRDLRRWLLPALVVGLGLVLQSLQVSFPLLGRGWVQEDPRRWPVGLLPELRQLTTDEAATDPQPKVRIFNDMLYGGYLIFHAPQLSVFIDDRCELYGQEFLHEYAEAEAVRPERVSDWAEQWRFRYVLTRKGGRFHQFLQTQERDWEKLAEDQAAVLYRRKQPHSGLTNRHQPVSLDLRRNLNNQPGEAMGLVPLELLKCGESGTIADVSGNEHWVCRLNEMGIRAGVRLTVLRSGSPTLLQVGSGRLSLRLNETIQILVQTHKGSEAESLEACPTNHHPNS